MSAEVRFEVSGMRSVASGLDSVAVQVDALRAALETAVHGYDGCWGNDQFGKPFAEGGNNDGYNQRNPALLNVLLSKSARLREYSTGLRDSATSLETTDSNNANGF